MASKSDYYKIKTKDWLVKKGYQVAYLEKYQRIFSKGKVIFIKKDIWGSDGMAMNEEKIIFWNSEKGKHNLAEHIKRYAEFKFPDSVRRWVVCWTSREKEPQIVELEKRKEEKDYWV